jgi:hypothetical protein
MSADDRSETFLGRWSRVKKESRETADLPAAPPTPAQAAADQPPPDLPPVDELTIDSDFSGFFHPRVEEDVRRSALRKLFSDPHFNVMDGLDTYIDDYSKTEPIPAAMLASMKQAQRIFEWAAETEEQAEVRRSLPPAPLGQDDPEGEPEGEPESLAAPDETPTVAESHPTEHVTAPQGEARDL